MRLKYLLTTFLLLTLTTLINTTTFAAQWDPLRKKQVKTLQFQLDSLQKAYDSLFVEYQLLVEPISNNEDEIEEEVNAIDSLMSTEHTPERIDSLLNIWYIQKSLENYEVDFESIERDTLTSNIPDSVYIERLNKMSSFIPLTFNRIVKNSIIRYTDKMPTFTQKVLSLSTYYLPIFEDIFDQYGLPKELTAMAIIESGLNPKAVSRARAKGMWQFMYSAAKQYGLNMTSFVDERFDPISSCHAAAKYLKDSYGIFGDWQLAIASYNCGAGNVLKAIRRSGGKTDFWDIYYNLPRETRGYVPSFIAALYTMRYYNEHNLVMRQSALPAHIDTFHVNKMLHFQQISDNIGITMQELRDVNPQYLHDIIPGTERTYILQIPHNYSMQFVEKEKDIYAYKDSIFFNATNIKKIKESGGSGDGQRIIHKVKKGETLGAIALKYRTSVSNIRRWNNIKGNTIRIGQRLTIYSGSAAKSANKSTTSTTTKKTTTATTTSQKSTNTSSGYVMYTVKKNDTLWDIANANGVSLNALMQINGFNKRTKIYPGMKIRIKKAQ